MKIKINEIELTPREVLQLLKKRNPRIEEFSFGELFKSLDSKDATTWECDDGVTIKRTVDPKHNNFEPPIDAKTSNN